MPYPVQSLWGYVIKVNYFREESQSDRMMGLFFRVACGEYRKGKGFKMIKVLFVDDEVLAMEYLQNLISWEAHGFEVVGHALNAKRALEMFDRERPEIVISDIKMVGMDGLELAGELRKRHADAAVILLSAYKDFEYAKKGIEYGVSNYLLKHELCEEKLLQELDRVRQRLEAGSRKQKIYQKYFARQLIYDTETISEAEEKELGNRFFLMLLHKNDVFRQGTFHEQEWNAAEIRKLTELPENAEGISYMADVQLTPNNIIMLYRIEDICSRYQINIGIQQIGRRIARMLSALDGCQFNLVYSDEIKRNEISRTFQKMSGQIRYAVFWDSCSSDSLNGLKDSGEEEKGSWNEQAEELRRQIYEEKQPPDEAVNQLFEQVRQPEYHLRAFKELLYTLENLGRELEAQEGMRFEPEPGQIGKFNEIGQYYVKWFHEIYAGVRNREDHHYSRLVQMMIRYIRQNFNRELSLETLGEEFQMNGVYLGQIFKKETGSTFLKYLTNCRMEEARRLLEEGRLNIYEISDQIGYKTSQYFSQIFMKTVGVTPQEYKRWNRKK